MASGNQPNSSDFMGCKYLGTQLVSYGIIYKMLPMIGSKM